MIKDFRVKFVDICKKIYEFGKKEHEKRMTEVDEFQKCVKDAKVENKKMAMTEIDDFEDYKKKV